MYNEFWACVGDVFVVWEAADIEAGTGVEPSKEGALGVGAGSQGYTNVW